MAPAWRCLRGISDIYNVYGAVRHIRNKADGQAYC